MRTFAGDGDVTHFVAGSGMSRWLIAVVGGLLVLWAISDLSRTVLPRSLTAMGMPPAGAGRAMRAGALVMITAVFFGSYSIPSLGEDDPVTVFMGRVSLLLVPVVVIGAWRRTVLGWRFLPSSASSSSTGG